jgi:hypothetical protein
MGFDELQSIWDSQKLPDGSFDQPGLLNTIRDRDRQFNRMVNVTDFLMTATLLFVACMLMRDPLLEGHDRVLLIPGIACLIGAGFVWKMRMDRKKREVNFDNSLLGLIEKSIDAIDSRISLMKKFLWWFAVPNCLGLVIALFIIDVSKLYLLCFVFIPAFVVAMAVAFGSIRHEIRTALHPERKRLEELKIKLGKED